MKNAPFNLVDHHVFEECIPLEHMFLMLKRNICSKGIQRFKCFGSCNICKRMKLCTHVYFTNFLECLLYFMECYVLFSN